MDRSTLFDAVRDIVDKGTSPSGTGMLAARLGHILTNSLPHFHWNNFGYMRLGDLLREMSQRGILRVGRSAGGALAVWPCPNEMVPPPQNSISQFQWDYTVNPTNPTITRLWPVIDMRNIPVTVPPVGGFRRLRKDFWYSFASPNSPVRFCNKNTGVIGQTAGEPASDWLELPRIDPAEQKGWATEFFTLAKLSNDPELQECLAADNWYNLLTDTLSARSMPLASSWKRFHSRKVGESAEGWCNKNSINHEFVFDEKPGREPIPDSDRLPPPMISRPTSVRDLLLLALSKASTEDLLDLKIPLRHVIDAIRPDLLKL